MVTIEWTPIHPGALFSFPKLLYFVADGRREAEPQGFPAKEHTIRGRRKDGFVDGRHSTSVGAYQSRPTSYSSYATICYYFNKSRYIVGFAHVQVHDAGQRRRWLHGRVRIQRHDPYRVAALLLEEPNGAGHSQVLNRVK